MVSATGMKQATWKSAGARNLSDGAMIGEVVTKVLAVILEEIKLAENQFRFKTQTTVKKKKKKKKKKKLLQVICTSPKTL